ncbi:hypothetical protein BHE74_00022608 [Ensete ventricosum]|nr:hypothetical protein GW17_00045400 [Ensete ventricosum]RWW69766.1 hypothetical protein BHE74_00022608 [Ensete ventricosum]RZS01726.1 hypothetical protein BHM03_00031639 [Ensete ventricosum]
MLNVYDDPSEQRSLSLDDTSSTGESLEDTRLSLETSNDVIPYIGQRFESHDAAYEFYSEFAKRCGFSIRRHRTEGKDGIGKGLTRRYFVCHRAGNTPAKATTDTKQQRNRKSSRCGCQAYMRISKSMDMGVSEWRVTGFESRHNHELLEPNQVRFLPAYRTISDADKIRIQMFAKSGISVQQMMRLMELERCVEPGYLPFTEKDVRNLLQSFRKVKQDEESIDLLRMCKSAPMEAHAASFLTPYAFGKLQDELVMAAHYASFPMGEGLFLVRHHTKMDGGRKVIWMPQEELLSCSCRMFEFSGILCRHTLRVLSTLNCFQIPERYLPIRWRRVSTVAHGAASCEQAERVQALQAMASSLVSEAAKSKERMDLATREISILLSRIKEQPLSLNASRNCIHKSR